MYFFKSVDVMEEDVLWTDKYQPQHSSDIIDNTASVKRLHRWGGRPVALKESKPFPP